MQGVDIICYLGWFYILNFFIYNFTVIIVHTILDLALMKKYLQKSVKTPLFSIQEQLCKYCQMDGLTLGGNGEDLVQEVYLEGMKTG